MRRNFVQFRSLKPELVNVELQVHTTWTDGRSTIAEQLESAQQRGLATIAFTEHERRDTNWFAGFAVAVREARHRYAKHDRPASHQGGNRSASIGESMTGRRPHPGEPS